jgi:hypothetical protein
MKQTQPSIDDRRNMVAGACLRKLCKAQPPSVAGLLGCAAARPAGESPRNIIRKDVIFVGTSPT